MAHTSSSEVILDNFYAKLEDAVIEKPAKLEGRMTMFLSEKR